MEWWATFQRSPGGPAFKIGTANIGDRQKGRLQARGYRLCAERKSITAALKNYIRMIFRPVYPLPKILMVTVEPVKASKNTWNIR